MGTPNRNRRRMRNYVLVGEGKIEEKKELEVGEEELYGRLMAESLDREMRWVDEVEMK